jgi:hypothetical protein
MPGLAGRGRDAAHVEFSRNGPRGLALEFNARAWRGSCRRRDRQGRQCGVLKTPHSYCLDGQHLFRGHRHPYPFEALRFRRGAGDNQHKRLSADLRSSTSLEQAEAETKITQQQVSRWRNGLRRPDYATGNPQLTGSAEVREAERLTTRWKCLFCGRISFLGRRLLRATRKPRGPGIMADSNGGRETGRAI